MYRNKTTCVDILNITLNIITKLLIDIVFTNKLI